MSKYDPLLHHLERSHGEVELAFADIEAIVGFPLPASARRHPAWWSNSGGTHVQSAAWQSAESVRFVPDATGFGEMKQAPIKHDEPPAAQKPKSAHPPAWGALKGMITLQPGVDLTEPSYPDWKALYGEDK